MKKITLLLIGLFALSSCSADQAPKEAEAQSDSVNAPILEDVDLEPEVQKYDENVIIDAPIVKEVKEEEQKKEIGSENNETVVIDAPIVEEPKEEPLISEDNLWFDKCANYNYGGSREWDKVYDEIIEQVCSTTSINRDSVNFVYGEGLDPNNVNVKIYRDTAYFAYTYWSQFVPENSPKWTFIITSSEEDSDWWSNNHEKYTPFEDSLNDCNYYDENRFCSYKYSPDEGKTNIPGYVFLWSVDETAGLLRADSVLDAGHNGPHWMQEAYGYEHWYEFMIEGHATLYELATHELYGNNKQRLDFAWLSQTVDLVKMTATTEDEMIAYLERCHGFGSDCNHFYYGGAAMFHEKLILDYGYENYMEWHIKLRSVNSVDDFYRVFSEHFDISVESFQNKMFTPYVLDSFNYYRNRW